MNINKIFEKDNNAHLGFIRLTLGILGSLISSYLLIMLITRFLNFSTFENIVIGIILLPLFWSLFGFWIIMSSTKFIAILKTFIPTLILYIFVFMVK